MRFFSKQAHGVNHFGGRALILKRYRKMLNKPYNSASARESHPKEGDLYKIITVFGNTFEIYYGYYEDSDRYSKFPEPVEVFPNFVKAPLFTENGEPFVTAIQSPCESFEKVRDITDTCVDCKYFKPGEELIGLCVCEKNLQRK